MDSRGTVGAKNECKLSANILACRLFVKVSLKYHAFSNEVQCYFLSHSIIYESTSNKSIFKYFM